MIVLDGLRGAAGNGINCSENLKIANSHSQVISDP